MKRISLFFVLLFFSIKINAQDLSSFLQKTEIFFSSVVENNKVNYAEVQKNPATLNDLVSIIEGVPVARLNAKDRKAFLINAYNILVIKEIIANYPITSTQKVNGFFEKIKHNVGGNSWTLNQIENDQIRKYYNDPRIHFVLNCAAISCPPVTNFAYTPTLLDQQLDQQTKLALNDPKFIYVKNDKNYISNIFKWYKEDFTKNTSIIEFINTYRDEKLVPKNRTVHYPYNWMLNDLAPVFDVVSDNGNSFIQTYTPSSLLKKGQMEIQLYNNLYTQTAFRDDTRTKIDLGERQNYFTGLINTVFGVSENRRWNVGFDINLRSVKIDAKDASPLKVLSFRKNDVNNRTAISTLGPVVKFVPFPAKKLSIKSSFLFPLTQNGENDLRDSLDSAQYPWFDYNRFTWWNQFFYDKNIGENWQLFLEADLLFRFAKSSKNYVNNLPKRDLLDTPVSAFLSYFPSQKSTVYVMLQYSPRFGLTKVDTGEKEFGFHALSDFAQTGIGLKYQVIPKLGLEISYTNFFTSSGQGAGNTFNLGIRYIN